MRYLLLIFPWLFLGCAPSYYLLSPQIVDPNHEKIFYFEDNEVIVVQGLESTIGIYGYQSTSNEITLNLIIKNTSDTLLHIIPEKFQFLASYNNENEYSLRVYNAKGYMKKIKSQHDWNLFVASFASALSSFSAGVSTQSTYGTVNGHDINLQSTTIDYTKKYEVQQKNMEQLGRLQQHQNQQYAEINASLLKRHSLLPNQGITGIIKINLYQLSNQKDSPLFIQYIKHVTFKLIMELGNDKYTIHFVPQNPILK
ncbi:MAG: hypothetical protein N2450_06425 [bacterium]|nr:hypothetical protein [bacterium]